MARWAVYAEYAGESLEVEIDNPELETEDQVCMDVLEFIQVWCIKVEED